MTSGSSGAGGRRGSAIVTLPNDTEIVITRVFDAPARVIFAAFTSPELVRRWWADDGAEWVVCNIDLRTGGSWRWVFRHGATEVGFHGVYRQVSPPHRLAYTALFEMSGTTLAAEDDPPLVTMTLDEDGAATTMTLRTEYWSAELRDQVLASGMEEGMQRSYDRLDEAILEDRSRH